MGSLTNKSIFGGYTRAHHLHHYQHQLVGQVKNALVNQEATYDLLVLVACVCGTMLINTYISLF